MPNHINTPTITSVTDNSESSSTFVVEPLHSGYGMTLGNSLRRVLLSSIEGAAITSFRVEGASHEFTTIDGVKEDIVEIMQNLKQIRFKVHSDEPQTLLIEGKKGTVTAKDIRVNADVEVINPDLQIATVEGSKTLKIEIVVENGRGYRTVEESSTQRQSTDFIALDAVFSPVLRVRYKVENTRVGQMTNLDKLIITVDTDLSITPRDAFEQASAILTNQYQALAGKTTVSTIELLEVVDSSKEEDQQNEEDTLATPIEDLNFSARTTNALVNNDVQTLKDLFSLTDSELKDLKGFGSKALDEVRDKLAELER